MKVVVLAKEVPDTFDERTVDLETGLADRGASEAVLDEISARALEVALAHRDADDRIEVVLLTMGPETAEGTIRKALAMGADRAVHVCDEDLHGADVGLTARVLAAAVTRESPDLVIAGDASTDGATGMVPAAIAKLLELPYAARLDTVRIKEGKLLGARRYAGAVQSLSTPLPAVLSVTEANPEPRLANFKGVVAAMKKVIERLTLADLGVAVEESTRPHSIMLSIEKAPDRPAGARITDDGDAGRRLADYLVDHNLVEKGV